MLQPKLIEIPGVFSIFSIAFSGDGQLYAEATWEAVSPWALLVYYWPEVLGGLSGIIGLLCLLVVQRIWTRPRRPGQRYCRRCNYEVSAGDSCPECGSPTAGRGTVAGRALWRRLLAPAAVGLAVLGIYTGLWIARLPRMGSVSAWFDWQIVGLHNWAKVHSAAWILNGKSPYREIVEIDPLSQRVVRTLFKPGGYWELPLEAAPDGHSLLFTDRRGRLVLIDTADGHVRQSLARLDGLSGPGSKWGAGWHSVAGFDDDGGATYVSFFDDRTSATILIRWDLSTGAAKEILRVNAASPSPGQLLTEERQFFIIPGTHGGLVASSTVHAQHSYGATSDILIHDVRQLAGVIQTIRGPFWTGSGLHFSTDGATFFRKLWESHWSEWSVSKGVELSDGRVEGFGGTLSDSLAYDQRRQRLFVASSIAVDLLMRSDGGWRSVRTLALPSGTLPREGFKFSADGRWLAIVVFPGKQGRSAIALFDLAGLH